MAAEIHLRFYEELNDYLPFNIRKREFSYPIGGNARVRQVLRNLGVPESEVELVLINGLSAPLSSSLQPQDRVSIYPVFESLDVTPLLRIRQCPLRQTRFVAHSNLSCLAALLRRSGFDVAVKPASGAAEIAESERRILLTTDPAFLHRGLSRVYVVRRKRPRAQLQEVFARFDLTSSVLEDTRDWEC